MRCGTDSCRRGTDNYCIISIFFCRSCLSLNVEKLYMYQKQQTAMPASNLPRDSDSTGLSAAGELYENHLMLPDSHVLRESLGVSKDNLPTVHTRMFYGNKVLPPKRVNSGQNAGTVCGKRAKHTNSSKNVESTVSRKRNKREHRKPSRYDD